MNCRVITATAVTTSQNIQGFLDGVTAHLAHAEAKGLLGGEAVEDNALRGRSHQALLEGVLPVRWH